MLKLLDNQLDHLEASGRVVLARRLRERLESDLPLDGARLAQHYEPESPDPDITDPDDENAPSRAPVDRTADRLGAFIDDALDAADLLDIEDDADIAFFTMTLAVADRDELSEADGTLFDYVFMAWDREDESAALRRAIIERHIARYHDPLPVLAELQHLSTVSNTVFK